MDVLSAYMRGYVTSPGCANSVWPPSDLVLSKARARELAEFAFPGVLAGLPLVVPYPAQPVCRDDVIEAVRIVRSITDTLNRTLDPRGDDRSR